MSYSNELYHYGVLGMKWGVHKARSYAQDTTAYRMRRKNWKAKEAYKAGKITKTKYKQIKRKNKYEKEDADIATNVKLRNVKKSNPDKSIASIYQSYKDTAYKEIPDYALKRGMRTAGKVLAVGGAVGVSALLRRRTNQAINAARRDLSNYAFNRDVANNYVTYGMDQKKTFAENYQKAVSDARRAEQSFNRNFATAVNRDIQRKAYDVNATAAGAGYAIASHRKKTRTKPKKRKG